jgi:hypothetical protein
MKLVQEKQPDMTIQNVTTTGDFRIKNSAKAFKILSSGLYSNKIRAIVRELSCNAVDSHKEAGKTDVPFEIHLPNKLEDWFSVKDFGVGLDHEGVTEVYTTYFESTKQDSNDYIGALGLGSKSPFSYTDTFSITAIKDGKKRFYTAYINKQGTPAISRMAEEDTDEVNGVEVKFSVKQEDAHRFQQEAAEVLKWFEQKPLVVGNSGFVIPELKPEAEAVSPGVDIMSTEDMQHQYSTSAFAVQGNIPYPISIPKAQLAGQPEYVTDLLSSPLRINFEIGELDIAASREELSYDDNMFTTNNILARLEVISKDIVTYAEDRIKGIECQWELADTLMKMSKQRLLREATCKMIESGVCDLLTAKKYSSNSNYQISESELLNLPIAELDSMGVKVKAFRVRQNYAGITVKQESPNKRPISGVVKTDSREQDLYEMYWAFPRDPQHTMIVMNDTNRGVATRLRDHFKHEGTNGIEWVYLLDTEKDQEENRAQIYRRFVNRLLKPTCSYLNASQLYKKETNRQKLQTSLVVATHKKYRGRGYDPHWAWDRVDPSEDLGKGPFYYVPLTGHTVLDKDGEKDHDFMDYRWERIIRAKIFPDDFVLYGVRKSMIDDIADDPEWIDIWKELELRVKKIDLSPYRKAALEAVEDPSIMNKWLATKALKDLDADSPYRALAEAMQDLYTMKVKSHPGCMVSLRTVLRTYDISTDFSSLGDNIRKAVSAAKAEYPMLQLLSEHSTTAHSYEKEALEYVKQTDMVRRMKK